MFSDHKISTQCFKFLEKSRKVLKKDGIIPQAEGYMLLNRFRTLIVRIIQNICTKFNNKMVYFTCTRISRVKSKNMIDFSKRSSVLGVT